MALSGSACTSGALGRFHACSTPFSGCDKGLSQKHSADLGSAEPFSLSIRQKSSKCRDVNKPPQALHHCVQAHRLTTVSNKPPLSRRQLLSFAGFLLASRGRSQRSNNFVASASTESGMSTASIAPSGELILPSSRETILQILEETGGAKIGGWGTLYAEKDVRERLDKAVSTLLAQNPTSAPGSRSIELGQGTWEVFHAPHISRMSSVLFGGTRFEPIRYILKGQKIDSNVRYTAPLIGSGWLSGAGDFREVDSDLVEVLFDSFWVDQGADGLKPNPAGKGSWVIDGLNSVGRALFFPDLSRFPVLYLDQDLVVFEFPPLGTKIAAARLDSS